MVLESLATRRGTGGRGRVGRGKETTERRKERSNKCRDKLEEGEKEGNKNKTEIRVQVSPGLRRDEDEVEDWVTGDPRGPVGSSDIHVCRRFWVYGRYPHRVPSVPLLVLSERPQKKTRRTEVVDVVRS